MRSLQTDDVTTEAGFKRYRMTVRTRLALTYSALLTGAGVVMLALIYVFMRFVPTYEFAMTTSDAASNATVPTVPEQLTGPLTNVPADSLPAEITSPASSLLINSPEQMFRVLLIASIVVLVVLAVAGILVGWIVAGRMLQPLQYINSAVRSAADGDLGHRIRLAGPRDEISDLANNFDDMLEKLERSFVASRRFAQNASHELRTPLATTRAMLDVAMLQHDSPELRQVFERLDIVNERNIDTVTALLELAEIESSNRPTELVDLAIITQDAAASLATESAALGLDVHLELGTAAVEGDPVLLRQLITNLVQNAVRHNVEGGYVTVKTAAAGVGGGVVIEVANGGPIIDAATVVELTEPFRRAAGRVAGSTAKGHGLGLSIVAAIVERHGALLSLDAQAEGGLDVVVQFPPQ